MADEKAEVAEAGNTNYDKLEKQFQEVRPADMNKGPQGLKRVSLSRRCTAPLYRLSFRTLRVTCARMR